MKSCYRVKFQEGERELDALEVLTAFEAGKITTETLIVPVGSDDWRAMRSEPDLLTDELYKRVRNRMRNSAAWFWYFLALSGIYGTDLLFGILLLSELFLANWQFVLVIFCWPILFLPSMIPCAFQRKELLAARLLIPYLNCIIGFLTIRKVVPQTRWINFFNPLVWLTLAGGLVASWFLPGNVAGSIAIYSIWFVWIVLALLLMLPGIREARRRYRQWKNDNPPPEAKSKTSTAAQVHFRLAWKPFLRDLTCYVLAIPLAIAVFIAPYYLVGKIRLFMVEREIQQEYIGTRIEHYRLPAAMPNAADEISKIDIPISKLESTAKEAEKLRPQLDRFRTMLRQYEHLGLAARLSDQSAVLDAHKILREYLRWRMLLKDDSPTELLKDLRRCREYELNEAPYWGDFAELRYAGMQNNILQKHLREFSEAELAAEQKRLTAMIDALPGKIKRSVYARNVWGTHQKFSVFSIPFCFRDNLTATSLRIAREEAKLRPREWYENIGDYRKFARKNAERSLFFTLFSDDCDAINRPYSASLAQYRLALAAIDLELHRRKHGVYPEKPQLSRDPFSGEPLRYISGKMLYSVNSDCVDDGGRHERRKDGDSTDIVFLLNAPSGKVQEK